MPNLINDLNSTDEVLNYNEIKTHLVMEQDDPKQKMDETSHK